MCQATRVPESGPWAQLPVLQNSGSQMFRLRVKTLSAQDCQLQNARKKNHREQGSTNNKCVTALTDSVSLSATQIGQLEGKKFSTMSSNSHYQTHCNWP